MMHKKSNLRFREAFSLGRYWPEYPKSFLAYNEDWSAANRLWSDGMTYTREPVVESWRSSVDGGIRAVVLSLFSAGCK